MIRTRIIDIVEKPKLTRQETVTDIGKRYFGIYTFLISEELTTIESSPMFVADEKKLKTNCPVSI